MYSIKNRKLRNFKNISCKNKPEAGWKGYNFECWKSELCVLAKFTNFIFLHIERFNSFLPIYSFTFTTYSFTFKTKFLFNTVVIFIQHFVRIPLPSHQWLDPRLLPLDSYLLETRVFKDTKIPNVFLVSMDVTSLYTPGGYSKTFYTGRLRPEVQPLTLFYWRMIPLSHT